MKIYIKIVVFILLILVDVYLLESNIQIIKKIGMAFFIIPALYGAKVGREFSEYLKNKDRHRKEKIENGN